MKNFDGNVTVPYNKTIVKKTLPVLSYIRCKFLYLKICNSSENVSTRMLWKIRFVLFFTNFFYIYMLLWYPFLRLFPIRFMNCSAGLVCSVFNFISAKNIQLFHNNIQISEFFFTCSCLQEGSCLIYIICVCLRIVVFNTYCVVIFFFVLCCQFLWIVYFDCHFGLL